jgi:preprotein translocase subunit SecG
MNLILSLLLVFHNSFYLVTSATGATDFMRETGKIHVVYGVLIIVFLGIVLFLIYLERKINRIEKKINNEEIT